MKNSMRFEQAVQKLYTAFYNNQLNPACCRQCAVGNILDQTDAWKHLSDDHGSLQLNYVGKVHQSFGRTFNGYSPLELLHIEATFLKACGYQIPLRGTFRRKDNDALFEGMSAVVQYLCTLDGISNVMDYQQLLSSQASKMSAFEAPFFTN